MSEKVEYNGRLSGWGPSANKTWAELAQGLQRDIENGLTIYVRDDSDSRDMWRIAKAPPKTTKVTIELTEAEVARAKAWGTDTAGPISRKVIQAVNDLRS